MPSMRLCRITSSSLARFSSTSICFAVLSIAVPCFAVRDRGICHERNVCLSHRFERILSARLGGSAPGSLCPGLSGRFGLGSGSSDDPSVQPPLLKLVLVELHLLRAHAAQKPASPVSLPEEVPRQLFHWNDLRFLQQRSLDFFPPGAPAGCRRSADGGDSPETA